MNQKEGCVRILTRIMSRSANQTISMELDCNKINKVVVDSSSVSTLNVSTSRNDPLDAEYGIQCVFEGSRSHIPIKFHEATRTQNTL